MGIRVFFILIPYFFYLPTWAQIFQLELSGKDVKFITGRNNINSLTSPKGFSRIDCQKDRCCLKIDSSKAHNLNRPGINTTHIFIVKDKLENDFLKKIFGASFTSSEVSAYSSAMNEKIVNTPVLHIDCKGQECEIALRAQQNSCFYVK